MPSRNGTLTAGDLELLRKDFAASPAYRLAPNALTRVALPPPPPHPQLNNNTDHSLSTLLDDWKVTNQEHSGRCWLFAGLNLLRVGAMKKMGLKDFEFSQNYAMFWDKIERANYFLEAIIETADRDLDDRTVAFLLDSVADDGGQWNMFVAVVAQHGLGPQAVIPQTPSPSNTRRGKPGPRSPLRPGGQAGGGAGVVRRGRRKDEEQGVGVVGPPSLCPVVGLRHGLPPRKGRPPRLPRDPDDPRHAVHRGGRRRRPHPQVAGGEQLGRGQGQGRLLHDERLVVRRVRLRDRGAARRDPRRTAPGSRRRADRAARLGPDGLPGVGASARVWTARHRASGGRSSGRRGVTSLWGWPSSPLMPSRLRAPPVCRSRAPGGRQSRASPRGARYRAAAASFAGPSSGR